MDRPPWQPRREHGAMRMVTDVSFIPIPGSIYAIPTTHAAIAERRDGSALKNRAADSTARPPHHRSFQFDVRVTTSANHRTELRHNFAVPAHRNEDAQARWPLATLSRPVRGRSPRLRQDPDSIPPLRGDHPEDPGKPQSPHDDDDMRLCFTGKITSPTTIAWRIHPFTVAIARKGG